MSANQACKRIPKDPKEAIHEHRQIKGDVGIKGDAKFQL